MPFQRRTDGVWFGCAVCGTEWLVGQHPQPYRVYDCETEGCNYREAYFPEHTGGLVPGSAENPTAYMLQTTPAPASASRPRDVSWVVSLLLTLVAGVLVSWSILGFKYTIREETREVVKDLISQPLEATRDEVRTISIDLRDLRTSQRDIIIRNLDNIRARLEHIEATVRLRPLNGGKIQEPSRLWLDDVVSELRSISQRLDRLEEIAKSAGTKTQRTEPIQE